jgi:hypothetical protein
VSTVDGGCGLLSVEDVLLSVRDGSDEKGSEREIRRRRRRR